jgi:PAS domain S-box-containing protein
MILKYCDTSLRQLFCLSCFLIIISCVFSNRVYAVNDMQEVQVGVYQFLPLIFIDDSGSPQGIFVDLIKEIAKEENWKLKFIQGSWSECLSRGRTGEIDLIASIIHQKEREAFLDFPKNYVMNIWGQVYIHKDTMIQSILDFDGKTVAVLKDGSHASNFMKLADSFGVKCKYQIYNSFAQVADAISTKRAIAGIFANIHGYTYESSHPIKQTQILFNLKQLKYATAKGTNHHLIEKIDQYLKKWKVDKHSVYYQILDKWFGLKEKEVLPDWLQNSIYIVIGLFLFIIVWIFILKYQVGYRTRELKESETRLNVFLKNSPVGFGILDSSFKYVYINKVLQEINGPSIEEHIGHSIEEVLPKTAPAVIPLLKKILSSSNPIRNIEISGEVPSRPGKMTHYLGSYFPISLNDEKAKFIGGVIVDITERKQVEEDLRKSEIKYRSMMESLTDQLYICSPELTVEYMNPAMIKLMGRDATGETCYKALHGLNHRCDWCVFDKVANGESIETTIISPLDGRHYRVTKMPIQNKNGTVSKMSIFRDITQYIEAVAEKDEAQDKLRHAQKMESIGTLTGGIAHDFNNIMAIILGNTELALDDVPQWNSAHSSLEEIKTASLRAKNIVKQLLSFSRKTDQKLQPIQIASVIKDALKFLRSMIPTTINIHRDIQTTDETIFADPTQINQIIMNLCINASHAMEQTGGDLNVTVAKVILDDNSARDYPGLKSGDHVKIIISDTGTGIDSEIINQIFDPYFTTKEVDKGSGMGLAVVHGIVKNHKGAIAIDSSLGKGSKFIILFPLTTEKPMVEARTTHDIPGGNETILFVDDEISIVKMVKRMFERLGYKIETATTPQDALEQFSLNPDNFDLVITDMTMPQMTGVKLSEKLMDIRKNIPIIVCTGHSTLVDEEKAKEQGLAAYVTKPIDMQKTAQTIRKVLDKK